MCSSLLSLHWLIHDFWFYTVSSHFHLQCGVPLNIATGEKRSLTKDVVHPKFSGRGPPGSVGCLDPYYFCVFGFYYFYVFWAS